MAGQRKIGPIQLKFRHNGSLCTMAISGDRQHAKFVSETSEVLENRDVPTWVEFTTSGGAEPDMRVRVELREGAPRVVELSWTSKPHQGEIRDKHLRETDLGKLATDLIASTITETIIVGNMKFAPAAPTGSDFDPQQLRQTNLAAMRFVDRQRRTREYRQINESFLKEVAKVYRDNINGAPTKAVAEAFNVERRMASTYVQRARKARLLPETGRGKKMA